MADLVELYSVGQFTMEEIERLVGIRLARAVVAQHYPLTREQVVHHVDGNQRNNDLVNLEVYASQADHMAVHHGQAVEPVWRLAGLNRT